MSALKQAPRYEGPVVSDFLQTLEQAHAELGDLFRMPFGKQDLLMLCHHDLAYEVLVKQKSVFVKLGSDGQKPGLQRVLGTGLLTNPEFESWFTHRQLIQPFFQRHKLEPFTKQILAATERLIASWRQEKPEHINLTQAIFKVTLELMFELVFSLSPTEAANYPITVPLRLASVKNSLLKRVAQELDELVYPLIQERKRRMQEGAYFNDFLALLLNAKDAKTAKGLSDTELRDELLTIFAAGHETTANALLWAFKALSEEPECLDKLKLELNKSSSLNAKSLKDLPYLQAVFRETLRLYPAIPFAPRVTLKATELAGFYVPKGSRVFTSIYSIHRNKSLWEDAKTFQPKRFLSEGTQPAYMPFGLGERVCVGQHLALLEGQLILASLLKHVDLSILNSSELTPKVAISLQPKQDMLAEYRFS